MKLRKKVKELLPESTLNIIRSVLGRPDYSKQRQHGEQSPDYYNRAFDTDPSWSRHYTLSPYYMIWTVVVDRLRRFGSRKVLEIGCGSGQLACAIKDAGVVEHYIGFDFSQKRLEQAKAVCPEFQLEIADAFNTNLIRDSDYDTVITTEFLEHVERDLDVVRELHPGSRIIATVPNFPYTSHVRHFNNMDEVSGRYKEYFDEFSVIEIPGNDKGKVFYLFEGVRNKKIV